MAVRPDLTSDSVSVDASRLEARASSSIYGDGIVAGLIGAGTVAVWFLVLDALAGRPLYTPTVLGTALFRRGANLDTLATVPVSLEMVGMFTWVHALVFALIGGVAAWLLSVAERNPNYGFGVVLLFVVFQAGFTVAAMLAGAPVIAVIGWVPILTANLLAAIAMAGFFWFRHRGMSIEP